MCRWRVLVDGQRFFPTLHVGAPKSRFAPRVTGFQISVPIWLDQTFIKLVVLQNKGMKQSTLKQISYYKLHPSFCTPAAHHSLNFGTSSSNPLLSRNGREASRGSRTGRQTYLQTSNPLSFIIPQLEANTHCQLISPRIFLSFSM